MLQWKFSWSCKESVCFTDGIRLKKNCFTDGIRFKKKTVVEIFAGVIGVYKDSGSFVLNSLSQKAN